jgi:endonuclease YncB( thermonuclease family)
MIAIIPAALALGLAASSAVEVEKPLPFIADDYPKALAEARAQRLPLFIEAWAPW